MSVSTTTLLELVRSVLLNIGERPVTSLNAPRTNVINKCVNAISMSLTEMENTYDWSWLRVRTNATSWNLEKASIPTCRRVYNVEYLPESPPNGKIYQPIPQLDLSIFYSYTIFPFPSGFSYPMFYAKLDNETFLFNPYPVLLADQNRIFFLYQQTIEMPTAETDPFPIPQYMIPLLTDWASYRMAITHLDDEKTARTFQGNVAIQTRMAIQRDTSNEPGVSNMYKGYNGHRGQHFRVFY